MAATRSAQLQDLVTDSRKDDISSSTGNGGAGSPPSPLEIEDNIDIPESRVRVLLGHEHEVLVCAWHPSRDILASASADGTARIWDLSDSSNISNALVLRHCINRDGVEVPSNKDVASLVWNVCIFYNNLKF